MFSPKLWFWSSYVYSIFVDRIEKSYSIFLAYLRKLQNLLRNFGFGVDCFKGLAPGLITWPTKGFCAAREHTFRLENKIQIWMKLKYLGKDLKLKCFEKGQCKDGHLLRQTTTLDESYCLRFCQKVAGCQRFTYYPSKMMCRAFSECDQVSSSECAGEK